MEARSTTKPWQPLEEKEKLLQGRPQVAMPHQTEELTDEVFYKYDRATIQYEGACNILDMVAFIRPVYIVLNLCAGHRRGGDIQAQIEWVINEDLYIMMCLSLDIAIDENLGDLTNAETVSFWKSQGRNGRVQGVISSPPCETWSVARYLMVEGQKAPPPLRTLTAPWGKDGLTLKQYKQLHLANVLLGVALDFTMIMLGTGGFAMLEHPSAAAYKISAPSIWRLPFTQIIANSPAGKLVHFRQRVHGQISEKPTTLLTVRLQTLSRYIHKPQCYIEQQPKRVLGGLSKQGTWETAAAKVYPPSMCRAIALAIKDSMDRKAGVYSTEHALDACADLGSFYVQHDPYMEEKGHAQDYMNFNLAEPGA